MIRKTKSTKKIRSIRKARACGGERDITQGKYKHERKNERRKYRAREKGVARNKR